MTRWHTVQAGIVNAHAKFTVTSVDHPVIVPQAIEAVAFAFTSVPLGDQAVLVSIRNVTLSTGVPTLFI